MVLLLVLWSSLGHMAVSRTKYLGEGSCACALGLLAGALLLLLRRATGVDREALRQLLTFNPADFFTCAAERCPHPRFLSFSCLPTSPSRPTSRQAFLHWGHLDCAPQAIKFDFNRSG